jgi:hypothetical protein
MRLDDNTMTIAAATGTAVRCATALAVSECCDMIASPLEMARAALRAQVLARGGDGRLSDVQIFLSDDGAAVMVFAEYTTSEDPPHTMIVLDGPITEDMFDPRGIAEYLIEDEVLH